MFPFVCWMALSSAVRSCKAMHPASKAYSPRIRRFWNLSRRTGSASSSRSTRSPMWSRWSRCASLCSSHPMIHDMSIVTGYWGWSAVAISTLPRRQPRYTPTNVTCQGGLSPIGQAVSPRQLFGPGTTFRGGALSHRHVPPDQHRIYRGSIRNTAARRLIRAFNP